MSAKQLAQGLAHRKHPTNIILMLLQHFAFLTTEELVHVFLLLFFFLIYLSLPSGKLALSFMSLLFQTCEQDLGTGC